MCFSAEASFISSAVLTISGVVAIKKSKTNQLKVFAAIPFLFGIQQFMEGLIWVNLAHSDYKSWTSLATNSFLFFAWIVWPTYIPLSARVLETNESRKKILNVLLAIGVVVSLLMVYRMLFHHVEAEIQGYHINYSMDFKFKFQDLFGAFYFIPIVFSYFISSVKRMWLLGAMALITFAITAIFYREHLISVWCFFAAITSIMVLWMVYRMRSENIKRELRVGLG